MHSDDREASMTPTQEQIDEALAFADRWPGDAPQSNILAAAYRAEKERAGLIEISLNHKTMLLESAEIALEETQARAELAERQRDETVAMLKWTEGVGEYNAVNPESWLEMITRHEAERKALG
jgi:hypothetical protein